MLTRTTLKEWLPLFPIGGGFVVVYSHQEGLNQFFGSNIVSSKVALICLGVGVVLIAVGLLRVAWSVGGGLLRNIWRLLLFKFGFREYRARFAGKNDLTLLHAWWHTSFGAENADLTRIKSWHKKNRTVFVLLYTARSTKHRRVADQHLVASFSLLPLSDEAVRLLDRNELSGVTLGAHHIVSRLQIPKGAYIGGIVAKADERHARGEILRRLKERIQELHEEGVPVYTRPVTQDGLRLVRKYHFVPVESGYAEPQLHRVCKLPPP